MSDPPPLQAPLLNTLCISSLISRSLIFPGHLWCVQLWAGCLVYSGVSQSHSCLVMLALLPVVLTADAEAEMGVAPSRVSWVPGLVTVSAATMDHTLWVAALC